MAAIRKKFIGTVYIAEHEKSVIIGCGAIECKHPRSAYDALCNALSTAMKDGEAKKERQIRNGLLEILGLEST